MPEMQRPDYALEAWVGDPVDDVFHVGLYFTCPFCDMLHLSSETPLSVN